MNKYMTENEVYTLALNALGLDGKNAYLLGLERHGEYAEADIWTEWLRYDCWVDVSRGKLAGVDCEPSRDEDLEDALDADVRGDIVVA